MALPVHIHGQYHREVHASSYQITGSVFVGDPALS
jgi:hypothetical protein